MIEEQKVSQPSRDSAEQTVEKVMSRLVDTAKVDAVFGHPVERGNATVIPCSEVSVGFGFGFDRGSVGQQRTVDQAEWSCSRLSGWVQGGGYHRQRHANPSSHTDYDYGQCG